jgi:hypothetical protein
MARHAQDVDDARSRPAQARDPRLGMVRGLGIVGGDEDAEGFDVLGGHISSPEFRVR